MKGRSEHRMTGVFDRDDVRRCLKELHHLYVLVPADKANNNVIIMCKRFYILKHRIRLGLEEGKEGLSHYAEVKLNQKLIIKKITIETVFYGVGSESKKLPYVWDS